MQVRIKARPTGLINGRPWPLAGETMELPDGTAEGMIAAGQVEPVDSEEIEETATPNLDRVETATPPRRRGRPRKVPQ